MGGLLKHIIPFLLLGILVTGGVEGFYRFIFPRLLRSPAPAPQGQVVGKTPATDKPVAGETAGKQPDTSIIVKRNLFQAKARTAPDANQKPAPAQPTATTLDLGLLGTVTGPPNSRRAIIVNKKTKQQELYYEGDVVQGAFVKEVQRGKVILDVNGKDEILIPDPPKSAPGSPNSVGLAVSDPSPMPEPVQEEPDPLEAPPDTVVEPSPMPDNAAMEPQEHAPPQPGSLPVPQPSVPAHPQQKQVVP